MAIFRGVSEEAEEMWVRCGGRIWGRNGERLPSMGWQRSAVPQSDTQAHTFSILTPRWLRSDVLSHAECRRWDANLNLQGEEEEEMKQRRAEQPLERASRHEWKGELYPGKKEEKTPAVFISVVSAVMCPIFKEILAN